MRGKARKMTESFQSRLKNAGIWLVIGSLLFLFSSIIHGIIHPEVGATAEYSISKIAQQASIWQISHLFFALGAAIFSAAALVMLNTHLRLADTLLGMIGWSLLAVIGGPVIILTTMEATAQTDAAIAGNLVNFSMWFSLSRGLEIVGILIPIAFLALAWNEFLTPTPIAPRWASALSMIGSMLVIIAIIGASWLRIVVFGSLFSVAILPILWVIWLGINLTKKETIEEIIHSEEIIRPTVS